MIQSLGFVRHFGSKLGTLLFSESQSPSMREGEELLGLGYFYSVLFESFYVFDEELLKETLDDRGFFGEQEIHCQV